MSAELAMTTVRLMLQNTLVSLQLFFFSVIFSAGLGLLLALGRRSKLRIVSELVRLYLLIMRGTPLILQLMFFYYAPYYLFGAALPRIGAAILGLSLNSAAYSCEIYRSGIESVPLGQYEAAQVLGFSKYQTFKKIILPQVIKRIIPPYTNEFMSLIKNTSLAQVIGVVELFRVANIQMAKYFSTIPLLVAGLFYLVMNMVIERVCNQFEMKFAYYR